MEDIDVKANDRLCDNGVDDVTTNDQSIGGSNQVHALSCVTLFMS